MEYNSISNEKEKKKFGILVPLIYIKKALFRIWSFLIKGLSVGLNCII